MAMYGHVGICRDVYGYVWLCMAMYGYEWLCMAMYGYVWLCKAMESNVYNILTNGEPLYDGHTTYLPFGEDQDRTRETAEIEPTFCLKFWLF